MRAWAPIHATVRLFLMGIFADHCTNRNRPNPDGWE